MFSPTLGRFITEDPKGFDAGDVHLYRYEGNDPLNNLDPSGLQTREKNTIGTKCEFPRASHLPRIWLYPDTKEKCLKGVPFWRKADLEPCPKGFEKLTIGGEVGWSGIVLDKGTVGPNGCGPCVGVVLIPPQVGDPIYCLHFTSMSSIGGSFEKVGFLQEHTVCIDKEFGGKIQYKAHLRMVIKQLFAVPNPRQTQ